MNRTCQLGWLNGLALAAVVSGCSSSDKATIPTEHSEPNSVSIVDGVAPSQSQKDRMLAAKETLFTRLSGRLLEAMSSQGPAAAILVCQQEAARIANDVGVEHELQIGRTGVRLRNPENSVPQWAVALTQAKIDTPVFATLSNGHAAALLPIKLQAQCLMCHGPKEQIAPTIQAQLTKLYPDDQATGFLEGELRGWFWIDLPDR